MRKKTLRDIDLKGKRVIMRVDFNVPIKNGEITDDTRVVAALPSIRHILDQGASLVLMSHLGRPSGCGYEEAFSLKPVSGHLAGLLGRPVAFAGDCLRADEDVAGMSPGDVMMLENTRFHAAEEGKAKSSGKSAEEAEKEKREIKSRQLAMAEKLASYGEVFVNDAFGSAHRAHASTALICRYVPLSVAGFLMEKELDYLGQALEKPERPFVAIIGGAKISGKLEVLESLIERVNSLLIGGGMAYTFLKARGHSIGKSLCEDELLDTAAKVLDAAGKRGVEVLLPVDNIVADAFAGDANIRQVGVDVPDGWMALDIGPETVKNYAGAIAGAGMVLWNGPMGCFEMEPFAAGTMGVCRAVAESGAISIIGGGDSVSAVNQSGLADRMSHISTGGGASLEFLEGKPLPGVESLTDA